MAKQIATERSASAGIADARVSGAVGIARTVLRVTAVAVVVVAFGAYAWRDLFAGKDVVVKMPAWYDPDVVAGIDVAAIRPAVAAHEVFPASGAQVSADVASDSPLGEMVPVEQLSLAFTGSSQTIAFEVEAVMNGKVSREVAEEVVVVAKKLWRMHQFTKDDPKTSQATLAMDRYFFAIWPDLTTLVRDGKVDVEVRRNARTRTNVGTGASSYAYSRDDEELAVSFHTPNYAVTLKMGRETAAPELFGEIVAQVEREQTK